MTIYVMQKSAREARARLIEEHGLAEYELGNALAAVDVISVLLDRQLTAAEREAGQRLIALSTWQQRAAQATITAQHSRANRTGRWWYQAENLAEAVGVAATQPDKLVWILMTDADWQSGGSWASIQLAAAWRLNNLNLITISTGIHNGYAVSRTVPVEPLRTKLAAFGLAVYECDSTHYKTLIDGLHAAAHDQRPTALLVSAEFGAGLDSLVEAGRAIIDEDHLKLLHELMSQR